MIPLNDGIIVELIDNSETTTGSGIILKNNTDATQLAKGKVLHINIENGIPVAPGDVVRFSKYKGVRFEEAGKQYVWLKAGDLLMKD